MSKPFYELPEWAIVADSNQQMMRDEALLEGRSVDGSEYEDADVVGAAEMFTPEEPPTGVEVWCRVLGPVEVTGWRAEPARQIVTELCCYMAHHQDRPVGGEAIREALWPEGSREAGAKSLRNYVSLLRASLGEELFPKSDKGAGYRVTKAVESDWVTFGSLISEATPAERTGDAHRAMFRRCRALGLVRGIPFSGVPSGSFAWAWSELLVSEIERTVVSTALAAYEQADGYGDVDLAEWAIAQGLRAVPLDEDLWEAATAIAGQKGATALLRVQRDRDAVLGIADGDRWPRNRQLGRELNAPDPGIAR